MKLALPALAFIGASSGFTDRSEAVATSYSSSQLPNPSFLQPMNYKLLGTLGILGAPFLGLGTAYFPDDDGLYGILYMTGWVCSLVGLQRLRAAGDTAFGRGLVRVLFGTLALAQGWNVWSIIDPNASSLLYQILDLSWPLSNLLMLPLGIAVIRANRLRNWCRFVPLVVGLWLPITLTGMALVGRNSPWMGVAGWYSAVAWALLGLVVFQGHRALRPVYKYERVPVY